MQRAHSPSFGETLLQNLNLVRLYSVSVLLQPLRSVLPKLSLLWAYQEPMKAVGNNMLHS
jgi:hypothetical protein